MNQVKDGLYKFYKKDKAYFAIIFSIESVQYIRLVDNDICILTGTEDAKIRPLGELFFKEPTIPFYRIKYSTNYRVEYLKSLKEISEASSKYKILYQLSQVKSNSLSYNRYINDCSNRSAETYFVDDVSTKTINYFLRGSSIFCYDSKDRSYLDYLVLLYRLIAGNTFNQYDCPEVIVHLPMDYEYNDTINYHTKDMGFKEVYRYFNYNSGNKIIVVTKNVKDFRI